MERRVIFFLYRLLQAASFPFLLLYLLGRVARDRRYWARLGERFGFLPFQATQRGGIWLHAVSVGEVLSAVSLVQKLREALPSTPVYVSVTTLAGRELAEQRLRGLADGIFFVPIDYCFAVRRVLRRLDPLIVVVLETEIWPNLWNEARRRGAGLLVLNGRISDAALPKYLRWRMLFAPVLRLPHRIIAQSGQDAERYRRLGATAVTAGGNLKYDIAVPAPKAELAEWIRRQGAEKIFIAASTMLAVTAEDRDEDEIVVDAFLELSRRYPKLLMILAPRRPERFDVTAGRLRERGVAFVRRSSLTDAVALPGVLLLDSMGELAGLFELGDAVFIGGSLVHWGGHNVLEPAASARPILVGPHMQNFAAIAQEFHEARALKLVPDPARLAACVAEVFEDAGELGRRAQAAARRHQGAVHGAVEVIVRTMDECVTHEPGRRWLHPLTWLWRAGVAFDRWRRTDARPLAGPVISVGNLTAGGTGKTPMVDWIARRLPDSAILTRGYGRRASGGFVVPKGARALIEETGDEAQIYLRSGAAVVGIGADRRALADRIEREHRPKRFILDDGFQHWPIPRRLDIVLIDTTNPFGGGFLLPRGRLRESAESLRRASVIVLTRCESRRAYGALIAALGVKCPIFFSRMALGQWHFGDRPAALPAGPVTAVCGLGNPGAFAASLREQGVDVVRFVTFPDHHRYTEADLAGIEGPIVTTEKDWVKIRTLNAGRSVYWPEVTLLIEREAEYLRLLEAVNGGQS